MTEDRRQKLNDEYRPPSLPPTPRLRRDKKAMAGKNNDLRTTNGSEREGLDG